VTAPPSGTGSTSVPSIRVSLPGNDDFTVKRPIDEVHRLPAIGQSVDLAWAPEHCRAFAREDVDEQHRVPTS
jgi:hypothetical protein